ncbi:tRNA (adenosine(37)-N6)-threonylcarbamoyltransferase complex transferase subunit TsaD [Patescibacteria group bacterium]
MKILGIETSCDETAVAVIEDSTKILSNVVSSQIDLHKETGGVVPEVAARAHTEKIIPVVEKALDEAGIGSADLDAIAVTRGPGLVTSLLVGVQTAKALAYAWEKPLIAINHIEGHIYATLFGVEDQEGEQKIIMRDPDSLPAVILTVSGGHTELALIKNAGDIKRLGSTIDDAAGEAFDKVAQLLGLGYPGGPAISRAAEAGDPGKFDFPRPKLDSDDFDFSFSGLKTAVLYKVQELRKNDELNEQTISDVAASFQKAVIDVLVGKTIRAAEENNAKTIMLSGGVAANKSLREELKAQTTAKNMKFIVPPIDFCTDNAVMIAAAAFPKLENGDLADWKVLGVDTTLTLVDLGN